MQAVGVVTWGYHTFQGRPPTRSLHMTTSTTSVTTATAAGPVLAIDLGKYKSVACL